MRLERWLLVGVAVLLTLVVALGLGVRYGVRTNAGRALVVKLLDGLPLGPVGRLHVEGMGGDLFDAFGFHDLSIIDAKGAWIDLRDVTVAWDPAELLARRVHATRLHARLVQLLRQPVMARQPPQPPSQLPMSIILDDVQTRVEMAPGFSGQRGLWDLSAHGDLRRSGAARLQLSAKSLLHAGDGATAVLRIGRHDRFLLRIDALEAQGGALAGAFGLPANQTLIIHADGDGTAAQGAARLKAVSGVQTPVEGTAEWGKAGVKAQARVSLAASRLTRYFADRLGPEARITLAAQPQGSDGLYAIQGALDAHDGALKISGPIDWAMKRTPGLKVDVSTVDFSKWRSFPKIGPARASGVLTGGFSGFDYRGAFSAERLEQYGYSLARMAGPAAVSLRNREWRIQGNVAGAGGAGKGVMPTLLGAAPHVQLDLSILKDGHVLFRTLNVVGAGVKIAAQGGQGLLGGLSFKGSAQITSLTWLHSSARGVLNAAWQASENSGAHAWDFSFDSVGAHFVSGFSDLDHFLGPEPHLAAKGAYSQGALAIADAKLTGATLQAQGKGGLDAHAALSAEFDWSAKGPITVGPVEIVGAAKGTGKLSGPISALRADLSADLAALDLGPLAVTPARLTLSFLRGPDGVIGAAAIAGSTAQYGPANAKTAFRFEGDGVSLSDIVADAGGVKLAGALGLHNGEPSSADLTIIAGPGAFLSTGQLKGRVRISGQAAAATADIALDGVDVSTSGAPTTLNTVKLRAEGPFNQLPFQVATDSVTPAPWAFTGAGTFSHTPAGTQIVVEGGGRLRNSDFKLLEPAVVRFGGANAQTHLNLAIAGGRAVIDAEEGAGGLTAKAGLTNVGLAAATEDFVGAVSGALTLHGQGAHLEGTLDGSLSGARSRDAPANEGLNAAVKGLLSGDRLHIDAVGSNAEGLKSDLAIDLPVEASAAPFRIAIDRTKALHGTFSADGEVRPLWDLFAGGERTLSGRISTSGVLQGSMNALRVTGEGALTGGKFRDVVTGLAVQNLEVAASFGDDAMTVKRFSGADGRGGSVSGDGRVSFQENGASTFTLNLKKFQLIDNDIGRATASGAVTVTHPAKGQGKLTGKLVIDRADIVAAAPTPTGVVPMDVVEIHQVLRDGQEKPAPPTLGPPINLDVTIKADRGVYVKGKGLSVELSLDSHVGGTILQPILTGEARVVTGSYDFAGKRFDMDSSGVVHLGSTPSQIRLNLTATWEDPTLNAVVRVSGTAAKPEISLTSIPILPQDEVLSRVLFGVSAAQLSAAQGAELASALASLTGGGGFDVIGNLRQFAGLDRLTLGGTPTTGTTISGGKYVTKDLYLELTGGGRLGSAAQLEWRIRHNLSLVTRYGAALDTRYTGDEDASISIRFRKDF
jgi:translocation and assembly module TamB